MDRSLTLRSNGLYSNKDPGASKNKNGENPFRLKGKGFLALIINQELVGPKDHLNIMVRTGHQVNIPEPHVLTER